MWLNILAGTIGIVLAICVFLLVHPYLQWAGITLPLPPDDHDDDR